MICFPIQKQTLGRRFTKQIIFDLLMIFIFRCQKRHDDFLKEMFKNDSDREVYQRKYEKEL